MGNRQNLPHHGTLKIIPDITNQNHFTEKLLLNPDFFILSEDMELYEGHGNSKLNS